MKKNKEAFKEGFMNILSEKDQEYVILEVSMDDVLQKALLKYANDNLSKEEYEAFKLDWAFNDILKKNIEFMESEIKVPKLYKAKKK